MSGDSRKRKGKLNTNTNVPHSKILSNTQVESIYLITSLFVRAYFLVMSKIATDTEHTSFGAQSYSRKWVLVDIEDVAGELACNGFG